MTEQDAKPSESRGPAAPVTGGDEAQPDRPPERDTAPKQCEQCDLAGVYAVTILDFRGILQSLDSAHGAPCASAKSSNGAGSSAKKQGEACSGQSSS